MKDPIDAFPAIAPATSRLPYAFRSTGARRALAAACLAAGLLTAVLFTALVHQDSVPGTVKTLITAEALLLAAACLWGLRRVFTPWLVLHPDRLEKRGLLAWRTLRRADIAATSPVEGFRGKWFEVQPRAADEPLLRLDREIMTDPVVVAWFRGIPSWEPAARGEMAAVLADPRYGATATNRAGQLKLAKRLTGVFTLLCYAIGVGLVVDGRVNIAVLALATAPVVVAVVAVVASRGLVVLRPTVGGVRPDVLSGLIPLAALSLWAGVSVNLLQPWPMVWAGAAAALAVGAALGLAARSPTGAGLALAGAMVAGIVGFGLAVLANVGLDLSTPQVFAATVRGKEPSTTRAHISGLRLDSWDGRPAGIVMVRHAVYRRTRVGDPVCVHRRPGALGAPWFEVELCPPAARR